jgi:hypothetical protein
MAFAVGSASGPVLVRLFNAVTLRSEFYRAVASDHTATGPAAATVCLVSLLRQSVILGNTSDVQRVWGLAVLVTVLLALLGWLAYGLFGYALARLLCSSAVSLGAVLRGLGYAETVTVTRLIAYLVEPAWYVVLHVILLVWSFAAVWIAMRAATGSAGARLAALAVPTFIVQHAVLTAEHVLAFGVSPVETPVATSPA